MRGIIILFVLLTVAPATGADSAYHYAGYHHAPLTTGFAFYAVHGSVINATLQWRLAGADLDLAIYAPDCSPLACGPVIGGGQLLPRLGDTLDLLACRMQRSPLAVSSTFETQEIIAPSSGEYRLYITRVLPVPMESGPNPFFRVAYDLAVEVRGSGGYVEGPIGTIGLKSPACKLP